MRKIAAIILLSVGGIWVIATIGTALTGGFTRDPVAAVVASLSMSSIPILIGIYLFCRKPKSASVRTDMTTQPDNSIYATPEQQIESGGESEMKVSEDDVRVTEEYSPINFRKKLVYGKPLEEKSPKCESSLYEIISNEVLSSSKLWIITKLLMWVVAFPVAAYLWIFSHTALYQVLFGGPRAPRRKMVRLIVCRGCNRIIG